MSSRRPAGHRKLARLAGLARRVGALRRRGQGVAARLPRDGRRGTAIRFLRAARAARASGTILTTTGDDRVRAVHSGFCGPATGQAFLDQQAAFDAIVEELLAERE